MADFDFDYLKELYIDNPKEFEKVTRTMIIDAIDSFPEHLQDIARAKQWRLEQDLGKIKNPLERMNRMVSLLWIQVAEFQTLGGQDVHTKTRSTKPCTVVDINKKE